MAKLHGALASLVLVVNACSSPTEPPSGITLLVTNTTCQLGSCTPQHILGFPENQPLTPGGFWSVDLGVITGATACLTFPPSASFLVIGWSSDNSKADTTTFKWTTRDLLSLGAAESVNAPLFLHPTTASFTPARSTGWTVSLPGTSSASPGSACSSY